MKAPLAAEARLSRTECLSLLSSGGLGRLAFSERALPAIATVQFAVDDESLIFRAAADAEWVRSQRHAVVAFQTDLGDPLDVDSWTVSGVGLLIPVSNPDSVEWLRRLPAWRDLAANRPAFMRLDLHALEGRRNAA